MSPCKCNLSQNVTFSKGKFAAPIFRETAMNHVGNHIFDCNDMFFCWAESNFPENLTKTTLMRSEIVFVIELLHMFFVNSPSLEANRTLMLKRKSRSTRRKMNSQTIGNQVNQIEKINIRTESTEVNIVSKRST